MEPAPRAIGVEAIGVGKHFGAFTALQDVSLKVRAGTVHALLGENGAGKSTLVKCLLGYHRADSGAFLVAGREAEIASPADADGLGLGMVYQHFTLVPSMTVAENLVLARSDAPRIIRWARERERLEAFLAGMPIRVPLDTPVGRLAAGQRQKAELLKQLYLQRRLIVLDEPTSTLTPGEASEVLGFVRGLVEAGALTVVIITHKLKEVAAFADDVTVLRRGRFAGGGAARELDGAALTAMMIGEPHAAGRIDRQGEPEPLAMLELKDVSTAADLARPGLAIESLIVRPREIVGVAGVSGNGQTELVQVLGGGRPAEGAIAVAGAPYRATRPEAHARNVRLLPEEPLRNACVPHMSVTDNVNFRQFDRRPEGGVRRWLDRRGMAQRARRMVAAYSVRAPSTDAPISALSGGNVQRAVLARELDGKVDLLIVANPCFGLDVKAAGEIRSRIVAARNGGAAVLLISEDLDEILELSDRIVVMREGRIVHEAAAASAGAQAIGGHMVGRA